MASLKGGENEVRRIMFALGLYCENILYYWNKEKGIHLKESFDAFAKNHSAM
jgi:hypothetical protein